MDVPTPLAYAVPVPPPTAPQGDDNSTYTSASAPSRRDGLMSSKQPSQSFRIPAASPNTLNNPSAASLTEYQISQLVQQGYTRGLAHAMGNNIVTFPLRYWVVDNSGSMAATDGKRLIAPSRKHKDVKMVPCTRWKEIQETVIYHADMAALLEAPTVFRLLNNPGARVGPQEFSVAQNGGKDQIAPDLIQAKQTMENASPTGVTPLTQHVYDIRNEIQLIAPQLQSEGRKVAIVLATDGLPSNNYGVSGSGPKNEFINAMRSLEGLPVWIVIRLCTNDDDVVEFYNEIDNQLELSIEVLDDFVGEAEEVYESNPWINYALPLHRIREMGFQNRLFDLLDERALTKGELREFCILLFGMDKFDGVPEPEVDFTAFLKAVQSIMKKEENQWNPVKNKMMPWLDLVKMSKCYGGGSSCTIM